MGIIHKRSCVLSALLCIVLITALARSADASVTANTIPTSDRDAFDSNSDGNVDTLRDVSALITGGGFSNSPWRLAMEFDISGVQPIVEDAVLTYDLGAGANPPIKFTVHGYAGDGNVTLSDMFVNNPIVTNLDHDVQSVSLTSFIQSLVGSGNYAGLTFEVTTASNTGFSIASSEATSGKPTLSVTSEIPEPAAGALLVPMSAALLRRRRAGNGSIG